MLETINYVLSSGLLRVRQLRMKYFDTLKKISETLSFTSCFKTFIFICQNMDYLRMDGKQYASKVRNKALEEFDWLSQWLEWKFLAETG